MAEPLYPVVFFDALRVKMREEAVVRNKAIYLALGVLPDVRRDILGLWVDNTEDAKFWLKVFSDLHTDARCGRRADRRDDGLTGIGEALAAAFPAITLQTRIVHLIRNSLDFASWKECRPRPRRSNRSTTRRAPKLPRPSSMPRARRLGPQVPDGGGSLASRLGTGDPVFAFPPEVRRVIYTTNAIESINARMRNIIKTRGHFPSDDAATKLIWLALRRITADWGRAAKDWKTAMNQFAILYDDRFTPGRARQRTRRSVGCAMGTSNNRGPPAAWQGASVRIRPAALGRRIRGRGCR